MGYHWVTQAQRYIQSLGFGSTLPAVNKRQQLLRIDQFGGDNSFYRDGHRQADDHARQGRGRRRRGCRGDRPRVRPLGAGQPGPRLRLHARLRSDRRGLRRLPRRHRVRRLRADRRRGLRRRLGLDLLHARRRRTACAASTATSTIPRISPREVHADGEIWSRALWDIRARSAPGSPTRSSSARSSASRPTSRCRRRRGHDHDSGPLRQERPEGRARGLTARGLA